MKQRELKFRVWDILTKNYHYPDKGYQGHHILYLNGDFTNLQNGVGSSEVIVQQYVGVNDKNGKDVYEGDYIKHDFPSDEDVLRRGGECQNLVEVRFAEKYDDRFPGWVLTDMFTQGGEFEVVGNIFEGVLK